mgnify:CR=1 FL=1
MKNLTISTTLLVLVSVLTTVSRADDSRRSITCKPYGRFIDAQVGGDEPQNVISIKGLNGVDPETGRYDVYLNEDKIEYSHSMFGDTETYRVSGEDKHGAEVSLDLTFNADEPGNGVIKVKLPNVAMQIINLDPNEVCTISQ